MKIAIVLLLCVRTCLCSLGQQNLGIRNGNYAGIQGALLNPSFIANSKLKWDVNVLSAGEVFDNTFLYAPKNDLTLFGFKRIIEGSIHENLFLTHFDPQNPNKLYNVSFSTEILGPSFFARIGKHNSIGLTIAGRTYVNIRDITGHMGQNAFVYLLQKDLWNTSFHDNTARLNSMGWFEYGLHYATVLYSEGRDELTAGISLNYLQGIAAAYFKNTNITYKIVDTTHILFSHSTIDYGRTDIGDYRNIHKYNDLNHGHGVGMDIGFTYVHLKDDENSYLYRIGISLIDIGTIKFNRNAATYHLQTENADFSNWHQSKFSGNVQLDQTLSAVFYHGDSTRSRTNDHFNMALPSAISIQADWNICNHFFTNATIIKGFGHGNQPGVIRPDVYSLTPRYETKWYEVSLPLSLLYYRHWQPRVGLAMRVGYFFFGGDAPGSLLKLHDLEGVDFYAGVHFFIPGKPAASEYNFFDNQTR